MIKHGKEDIEDVVWNVLVRMCVRVVLSGSRAEEPKHCVGESGLVPTR